MQSKSTIDNHREIGAALDFLQQASVTDGVLELDPRVVSGWVEMILGALAVLVKAKRGKHADDKALKQTVEEHLSHSSIHLDEAYEASVDDCVSGYVGRSGLDDDNLPHYDHATARIALLYARKAIVGREKSENPLIVSTVEQARDLFGDRSDMYYAAVGALQDRVTPVVQVKPADKFSNSCKVHKLEHGVRCGVNWFLYCNASPAVSVYPTCLVETENKPGKVDAKCVTPIANWNVYVDGHKLTNCKLTSITTRDIGLPGTFSETVFGSKPVASTPIQGGGKLSFYSGVQPPKADMEILSSTLSEPISLRNGESVGIAAHDALKGEFVTVIHPSSRRYAAPCNRNIYLGDFIYQRDIYPCHGCSYAKWPNKGPGYSARCDKCKLDANRPGYVGK